MDEIQLIAISHINLLARKIQRQHRTYYNSRIIEFLTDIIKEPIDSNVSRLIDYVDDVDKEDWSKIFSI